MTHAQRHRPGDPYRQRINAVIDHIVNHLDQPLKLDTLAAVACFSPHHFHRIFRSATGEPLAQFVKRLRLERAATMISRHPEKTLTELAMACGFSSPADFSRSFKAHYGVAPSAFDAERFRHQRRQQWQHAVTDEQHRHLLDQLPVGENPDGFKVRIKSLPARYVAYIRVHNPYRERVVEQAAQRLIAHARAAGWDQGRWLGYMWDDPEIVHHPDARYDVAVEIAVPIRAQGEVGCLRLPPMQVAELAVRGGIDLEQRALDWLYQTWLPSSGFVPSDQPCFEAWVGLPFAHGMTHFELDLQLPVEPV